MEKKEKQPMLEAETRFLDPDYLPWLAKSMAKPICQCALDGKCGCYESCCDCFADGCANP